MRMELSFRTFVLLLRDDMKSRFFVLDPDFHRDGVFDIFFFEFVFI